MLFRSAEVVDEMLCHGVRLFQRGKHVHESKKVGFEAFVLCALGKHLARPRLFVEERGNLVSHELKKLLAGSSNSRLESLAHGITSRSKKDLVEYPIIKDNGLYVNNEGIEEFRIS